MYFTNYLCVAITLLNTELSKSAFSTYSFGELVFRLYANSACSVFQFHLHKPYNICIIIVYVGIRYSVILFSFHKKQFCGGDKNILRS